MNGCICDRLSALELPFRSGAAFPEKRFLPASMHTIRQSYACQEIIRIDISNNLETPARICYYRIGRQRYAAAADGGQGDFPYCHISDHGGSGS